MGWLGIDIGQLDGEICGEGCRLKALIGATLHRLGSVAIRIHVGTDNHRLVWGDRDWAASAFKGLLIPMAMGQNAPIEQISLLGNYLPPVGVLIATRIRTCTVTVKV